MTKVADLLTPMMQCTRTFPVEKDGKYHEGQLLKRKKKQYNIHIQFTIFAHQGFVYEVSCRFKVLTEVKVL